MYYMYVIIVLHMKTLKFFRSSWLKTEIKMNCHTEYIEIMHVKTSVNYVIQKPLKLYAQKLSIILPSSVLLKLVHDNLTNAEKNLLHIIIKVDLRIKDLGLYFAIVHGLWLFYAS